MIWRGRRSRMVVRATSKSAPRGDTAADKPAREENFRQTPRKLIASRSVDTVAQGEKGGLNFLYASIRPIWTSRWDRVSRSGKEKPHAWGFSWREIKYHITNRLRIRAVETAREAGVHPGQMLYWPSFRRFRLHHRNRNRRFLHPQKSLNRFVIQ